MIEFISRLPQGYQEVEYIESSGTQYIVVDFIPNQDTRLDMLVEPRSVATTSSGVGFIPYGSAENYNSKAFECFTNATGKLEFNYDGQYQTDLTNVSVGTKINISHNKNNIVVTDTNGQTIASHSFNYRAFTCPRNLALFAINRSTALVGQTRIYSCQIYNDTTLALALVPCYRKSDNVAGLYDLVNNVFYTNAGSGVFAVGSNMGEIVITPGGAISFSAALRRRMMINNNKVIFSYTGNCDIQDNCLRLLSSGTLRFNRSAICDIFLVGGGAGGSGGSANTGGSYDHYYAGPGGGGGYTVTKLQIEITDNLDITVTIGGGGSGGNYDNTLWGDIGPGQGGAGGSTSFGEYSASGGRNDQAGGAYNGGAGGSGGAAGQDAAHGGSDGSDGESRHPVWKGGTGQGTTTRAFAEANGTLFSNGGDSGVTSPSDRIANTGDGGHGAMGRHKGGAGGSGIVILRFPEGTTITQQ